MVDFPSAVAVPPTSAYAPPNMAQFLASFLGDTIGNLPNDYYQGKQNRFQDQQNQRTTNLQQPINSTDPNVVYKELLQRGGAPYAEALMPFIIEQQLRQQAGQPDPFLSPGGGPQTNNAAPAAAPALARPAGATPATYAGGDSGVGTITDIVTAKLPQNSTQTGQDIAKIAQTMGIDPNAPLTPGQQRRVQGLVDRYTQSSAAPAPSATAPAQPGSPPAVGTPNAKVADAFAALPPSAGAVLPAPQQSQGPGSNATASAAPVAPAAAPVQSAPLVPQPPMSRGGAGIGSIVDIVRAAYPENSVEANRLISRIASTMETEPNAPLSSGQQVRAKGLLSRYSTGADSSVSATAASAPAASDQSAQPPAQPLKPQYRLPQNPATGKQFTPQEAVIAIDDQISKLSGNKFAAARIKALEDMRDRYAAMVEPMEVRPGMTFVDPKNNQVIYQAPGTFGRSGTPEMVANIAQGIKDGSQPPVLTGLYGMSGPVRSQLEKDGFDLAKAQIEWKRAEKQIQSLNGPQMTRFVGLAQSVDNTIDEVKHLSEQMELSGVPALNSLEIDAYIQTQGNSKNGQLAARYVGAVNTLKEEFANLAQGGYAPTESVWALANRQINENYGVKELGASLEEVQRLIRYRVQAIPNLETMGPNAGNRYTGQPTQDRATPNGGGATMPPAGTRSAPSGTGRPTIINPTTGQKMILSPDGKSWLPAELVL